MTNPDISEFTLCQGIEPQILAAYPCAKDGVPECDAVDAPKSFICSRPKGHAGPHVAYGGEFTVCAAWPQSETSAESAS